MWNYPQPHIKATKLPYSQMRCTKGGAQHLNEALRSRLKHTSQTQATEYMSQLGH